MIPVMDFGFSYFNHLLKCQSMLSWSGVNVSHSPALVILPIQESSERSKGFGERKLQTIFLRLE